MIAASDGPRSRSRTICLSAKKGRVGPPLDRGHAGELCEFFNMKRTLSPLFINIMDSSMITFLCTVCIIFRAGLSVSYLRISNMSNSIVMTTEASSLSVSKMLYSLAMEAVVMWANIFTHSRAEIPLIGLDAIRSVHDGKTF